MVRTLTRIVAVVLLALGAVVTGAAAPVAVAKPVPVIVPAACGSITTGAVFGGYRSRMVCDSRQLDGFGSTTAAAQQNVLAIRDVAIGTGVYCLTASLPASVNGGYRTGLSCDSRLVEGYGTTLTDVGTSLRDLAWIGGRHGVYCGGAGVTVPAGGFKVGLSCNSRLVEGHGNTLTAAAVNATGFARLGGEFGSYCSTANYQAIGGGYRIGLSCNSRAVQSAGSTITDAGVSALAFADLAARTGRHCANVGVQVIAGGYRMTVLCTPGGSFAGQGPTLSAAAAATLQAAS